MYSFTILVQDTPQQKVSQALIEIFKDWNFELASEEIEYQYTVLPPDGVDLSREGIQLRAFLISPHEGRWCSISPSHEVWFAEMAEICKLLSQRLMCPVFLLSGHDSEGGGYFLYDKGVLVDKFHNRPDRATTLREREVGWPEELLELAGEVSNDN